LFVALSALVVVSAPLRIAAVGDIQMGQGWPEDHVRLPPDDAADFFTAVAPILQDADLTFGNLETTLADSGDSHKCDKRKKCYAYRVPTAFAQRLADAGFDVVSLANNHAQDFGRKGVAQTVEALERVGVRYSGANGEVARFQIDGRRVSVIAFGFGKSDFPLWNLKQARRLVREMARDSIVLVSFHGGSEGLAAKRVPEGIERYRGEFRGNLRVFTHAVVDAGADLVIGHGPHVLRGVELYKGRLIAYSLGNFASYRSLNIRGDLGVSCILRVGLADDGALRDAELIPVKLVRPGPPTPVDDPKAIAMVRWLSNKDFGDAVFDSDGRFHTLAPVAEKVTAEKQRPF
jgi:hypothetical protein